MTNVVAIKAKHRNTTVDPLHFSFLVNRELLEVAACIITERKRRSRDASARNQRNRTAHPTVFAGIALNDGCSCTTYVKSLN